MYGDGFLDGVLGEAQNNLSGFISSMAPSRDSTDAYRAPDNNWGIQAFQPSGDWGVPGFSIDPGWGISGFRPNDNDWRPSTLISAAIGKPNPPKPGVSPTTPGQSGGVTTATDSPYYPTAVKAAQAAGYDTGLFTAQIQVESHFDPTAVSPKGARGIAQIIPQYHPGVNPDDPNAALIYAAQLMAQYSKKYGGDTRWALAAYNMGETAFDQIWNQTSGHPEISMLPAQTQKYIGDVIAASRGGARMTVPMEPGSYAGPHTTPVQDPPPPGGGGPVNWGQYNAQSLVPDQYHEGLAAGYDKETALSICGPAAAVAFTRAYGRAPATLQDATEAARIKGLWDTATGMHGPESEAALMRYLGVPAHTEAGVDWNKVAQEVQAGHPVALSAPTAQGGHYLVATGYDSATGKFEFGSSAGVLIASGGRTQWAPSELGKLGIGPPATSIYMDR